MFKKLVIGIAMLLLVSCAGMERVPIAPTSSDIEVVEVCEGAKLIVNKPNTIVGIMEVLKDNEFDDVIIVKEPGIYPITMYEGHHYMMMAVDANTGEVLAIGELDSYMCEYHRDITLGETNDM